ncbi:MAG: SpoIIE family protein phosphatase [Clostridia bacterium]|nr:SpoIIE family protein phosphatase [Clostridia bacterium]
MKKPFDFLSCIKQIPLCLCVFALAHVGEYGEPFGLSLLLGLGAAGYPLLLPTASFIASALLVPSPVLPWIYIGSALLLLSSFFLRAKLFGKSAKGKLLLPFSAFTAALLLYAFLTDAPLYPLPFSLPILQTLLFQRTIVCLLCLLLAAVCAVAANAVKNKLLRCKLRIEESLFSLLVFTLSGVGFARLFGLTAYTGVAFYLLLVFCAITQDAWGTVCAFVLALPPLLVSGTTMERFFFYGVVLVAFSKTGKLGEAFSLLCTYLFFGYLDGIYALEAPLLVAQLVCVLVPIIAFLLTPQALLQQAATTLVFYRERHLSRLAINRNRTAIAERLFEVSGLFKQIQSTFLTLGNMNGETEAKEHMQGRILNGVCKRCSGYGACLAEGLLPCLQKMIDVGCIKGRVSLIDVPHSLAGICGRQSDLLHALNQQLGEYRTYMQDAEAAACGRQLLANQALGVSEIAKKLALEQSEPITLYTKKERALEDALLKAGIVCTEILIYGSEELTVSLVVAHEANVKKLSSAVSHMLAQPFCVVEKLTLARDKFCYILRKKPPLDAIFGVATRTKEGEIFSGDTHTVLRIDEKRFLVSLSDGMGSGEYARQISENTLNLLESFYRTNMPPELTLATVNRLLSFAKEETFACVDIAVVDLDFCRVDIIKIGSPTGFILSDSALQILENDSLPLGILERIHPTAASYPFRADDTLVFLSDGITEAFPSTVELYETVQALPRSNPQEFADRLLAAALDHYGGVAKDDMTVLAVRVFASQ